MGRESEFQSELVASGLAAGLHPVVLADEGKKNFRFGSKVAADAKPYDMAFVGKNLYIAMELKDADAPRFAFSEIRENQWDGLRTVEERGWPALLVVNFYTRLTPKQQKELSEKNPYLNEAYGIPHKVLKRLKAEAHKSVSVIDCRTNAEIISIPRVGDDRWDLKGLMNLARSRAKTPRK